jgi:hypothetical protein
VPMTKSDLSPVVSMVVMVCALFVKAFRLR